MSNEVARTILQQLGGNKFIAMTGAKDFVYDTNLLAFRIPIANHINRVTILLRENDTYKITFFRSWDRRVTEVSAREDLYADQLQPVFTKETGLHTHL